MPLRVVCWWPIMITMVSRVWSDECLSDGSFQIDIDYDGPLGLRLNEQLEIVEFRPSAQGYMGPVEATGIAEVGDRLIGINDIELIHKDFDTAIQLIQQQTGSLKTLQIRPYDDRCSSSNSSPIEFATPVRCTLLPVVPCIHL